MSLINRFQRLKLVDWRLFVRQAKWALLWQMYLPEGTDIAIAIDDGELEKAKLLLAHFERLVGSDHFEVRHFRTEIEFEEQFPDLEDKPPSDEQPQ